MPWSARLVPLCVAVILSLLTATSPAADDDPPGAYKAPSPEPTPAETQMLEFINRCRADPAADAQRCITLKGIPKAVNLAMFVQEMGQQKAAQPLVFDLRMLKAARWHSHYQILNEQVHDESPDAKGFTARRPGERLKLVGYSGASGENIFRSGSDPWESHCAFVIDWGAGPGHMQPERGHRRNILNPKWRWAGIAAVPHTSDKIAVTHEFGTCKERWLGGVVLDDRNKNRTYDIGEGVGGVSITVGEETRTSWASGAYALPISTEAAKLVTALAGKKYATYLPAGEANVKFDIFVSDRSTYDRNADLLRKLKQLPQTADAKDRRRAILVDLYLTAQESLFPEAVVDEVRDLSTPAGEELREEMDKVRMALSGKDLDAAKKAAQAGLTKYGKSRARPFFADAQTCLQIKQYYVRLEDQRSAGKSPSAAVVDQTVKAQQQLAGPLTVSEWKLFAAEIITQTSPAKEGK